ncbi:MULTISPECIES: Ig-like domain repeat protein [unclassified Streptomyces]|uniref:YncE family protein n=1 Tax=unclassified Streptomyces TaxID=2593676 RepID=UPI00236673DE|nr:MULTISPECIES: Ig-like domain repeat protein [unclassified Streptomyces]MDF3143180.1 Ig-like domain repeat protein [Streptomyces sp. T21Q-yed]WDF39713.1 Ig-like domain repeat protein [Streptomyces sp. T12]
MRSTSAATALAVLFSSAALTAVSAGTASAVTATVGSPGGIVVSDTLKRVFVGDDANDRIVAADYNGNRVDSVDGIDGIFDLALSDDGGTLYAAARVSHEIVALDAATLDVKARYPVATNTGPVYVEFAGGKVWFSYGDQWDGDLGSVDPAVDPASGADPVALAQLPTEGTGSGLWGQALLDTEPLRPGLLAVGETGDSSGTEAVLDVSSGTPEVTAWHDTSYALNDGVGDIDLVAGSDQVLVNGTDRHAYANGTFAKAGAYPAGQRADIGRSGLVAQISGTKVAVYRPNATQPVRTYSTGTQSAAALAWAPDSSRIFALVNSASGYTLKALTDPTLNVPTLTVNAPASATRAKQLTVTGKISATLPLPSGVQLTVTRTDLESPNGKALAPVTVKADGTYSFTDTPPAGGKVKYAVKYAGDAVHTAATASDTVEVSRNSTSLSLNNNGKLYNYGADVKFTAHLGTTYKNRSVEIWADPFGGDKPNKLIKTGTVNSDGNISALVDMTRDTAVTAVFKGDARYKPKTAKVTAYARVKVSTAVSRHYKTAKIGTKTYYWFHKSTDPLLTTTMTYYPGRQQRFDLQVYYQGTWYSADSEYFPLGANGKSAVTLEAPGESGIKARMRSVYVNGSSGDTVNSTTYGAWKYLYFSN